MADIKVSHSPVFPPTLLVQKASPNLQTECAEESEGGDKREKELLNRFSLRKNFEQQTKCSSNQDKEEERPSRDFPTVPTFSLRMKQ